MESDDIIESHALNYAKENDPEAFEEIFRMVKPRLDRRAQRSYYKYQTLQIPLDDFHSHYYESVWEATVGYDGRTRFWQRLYTLTCQKDIFLSRRYSSKKRATLGEECLDNVYYLNLVDNVTSTDITEIPIEKQILEGFARASERQSNIIQLLLFGCSNLEIAHVLGSNEYDTKTRKTVQRAKDSFRQFVSANMAS